MRRAGQCKACRNAYSRKTYDSDKQAIRYQVDGKEKQRKYMAVKREDPEWVAKRRLAERLRKYGLSRDEYEELVKKANGICAICTEEVDSLSFHIDHCHDTGKVRGLLCGTCNPSLGHLEKWLKDQKKLDSALKYLEYIWPVVATS